jgi:hypothetical protein
VNFEELRCNKPDIMTLAMREKRGNQDGMAIAAFMMRKDV